MKQDTKIWVAIGALVAIALVVKDKPAAAHAGAGVFDVEDDFAIPPALLPTPTRVFTPAPDSVTFAFDDGFELGPIEGPDYWTSIDVVELGVEAGKSVTRAVVGTIDPLAAITRIIPGVPTVGPLYTPVDLILGLF